MPKERLLVLDANALIHRAFHALPLLTNPAGEPVGALYGLCLTLLNVFKTFKPSHVLAAFDRPEKTFRHEQFEGYKAQRAKAPDELTVQLARARDVLTAFAVPLVDAKGFEADDVIGTVTTRAAKEGLETVIVTGDQDTMQLVGDKTRVHLLRRGVKDTVTLGPKEVEERFGLTPAQMVDFKALRGDPSDNIPGVRGIGEKTATDLLQKYKTLNGVYRHLKDLPESVRRKLAEGKEAATLSRRLAEISRTVPLVLALSDLQRKPVNRVKLIALFQELGFASLLPRLSELTDAPTVAQKLALQPRRPRAAGYNPLISEDSVKRLVEKLRDASELVVDTETERLGARTEALHGVSLAVKHGEAWYVPAKFVSHLRPLLENPKIAKYGHNLKYDLQVLNKADINLRPIVFDTMLASYVLAPGTRAHDLDTLAFTLLGHEKIHLASLIGSGKQQKALSEVLLDDVAEYSCEDADMTLRLARYFQQALAKEPRLREVFETLEVPLIPVLAHMELTGIRIDPKVLRPLAQSVQRKLRTLEKKIHGLAGSPFNISSPQQLRRVLFEELRLPAGGVGRTQSGLSTAAEELEKLRGTHAIIPFIQEYRELSKLKGTYIDTLPKLIDPKTGRVHTTYNQTIAATGRLSSADPNLQNIPIRTELGQEIRKAFVAERGYTLLAADYSQLQLRLAAHIARDRAMQRAFRDEKDIHAETAAFVFDVPVERVTSAQRRVAKTLNFGVLYGMGPQAFARAAGISVGEAQRFIDEYFRTYRGIAEYMEEAKAAAASQGYVETIHGRRRYLPEISSRNPNIRSEAERMAINHPIQGSEADVVKKAMIAIFRNMEEGRAPFEGVRMILQVHDELVFEVPTKNVQAVAEAVVKEMEAVEHLDVPLVAEAKVGKNWGNMRARS